MKHGEGTFIDNNGTKFIGNFLKDHLEGEGVLIMTDGTKFKGEFV